MKTKIVSLLLLLLILLGLFYLFKKPENKKIETKITPTPTQVPTPTPPLEKMKKKKMSFEEINEMYGPCTKINVLMYHHIQKIEDSIPKGQKNLTVDTNIFRKQMQYLKDKNYAVVGMDDLKNFLENGVKLPSKSVLITVDDAYKDNYLNMFPILKEFGFKATIFTPTGLVNNPDYLTWGQIEEMKSSGLIYFGNHTWSHHNSSGTIEVQEKEIGTADKQLAEKDLDKYKIFAYPYGKPSNNAEKSLEKFGYKIAFTTTHGNFVCKKQNLEIPRIRIGNANLISYGL